MKFGIREICDVVLRAKSTQKIGNKIFYKNEPVCYFDTLKTSTLEGSATTVYATGGRGNTRLVSWDGEKTVTFSMEDALISPIGLSILTGAGLIEATDSEPVVTHTTETFSVTGLELDAANMPIIYLTERPYEFISEPSIYVMGLSDNGDVMTEPFLYKYQGIGIDGGYAIQSKNQTYLDGTSYNATPMTTDTSPSLTQCSAILVDYYTARKSNAVAINISPNSFAGSFYLEASTLWRDQSTGKDLPAEFIIPNCRVQSNFNFTMSSSGDPSTFNFVLDAFPDYVRGSKNKEKVLATIQVLDTGLTSVSDDLRRTTWASIKTSAVDETDYDTNYRLALADFIYKYNLPAEETNNWEQTGLELQLKFRSISSDKGIQENIFTNQILKYFVLCQPYNPVTGNKVGSSIILDENAYTVVYEQKRVKFNIPNLNLHYGYEITITPYYETSGNTLDASGIQRVQPYHGYILAPLELGVEDGESLIGGVTAQNKYKLLSVKSLQDNQNLLQIPYGNQYRYIPHLMIARTGELSNSNNVTVDSEDVNKGTVTNISNENGSKTMLQYLDIYIMPPETYAIPETYLTKGAFNSVTVEGLYDDDTSWTTVETFDYYELLSMLDENSQRSIRITTTDFAKTVENQPRLLKAVHVKIENDLYEFNAYHTLIPKELTVNGKKIYTDWSQGVKKENSKWYWTNTGRIAYYTATKKINN